MSESRRGGSVFDFDAGLAGSDGQPVSATLAKVCDFSNRAFTITR